MSTRELAFQVCAALHSNGYEAFLVGGCVRDLLLGRSPKDYDIATNARPEQVLALFPAAKTVGAHFGVVLVAGAANAQVEVSTYRSDGEYADGRRPLQVVFETDVRKDVWRRDFTINALLMEPVSSQIFDYVGGRADLEAGLIRALGEPGQRFREDYLRLLRAVRFAARFGFRLDPGTEQSMRRLAPLAASVAPERVRDELVRILTEGGARRGMEILDATGLLEVLLPEVARLKGVQQPPDFHPEGDVWTHTLIMLEQMQEPTPTLAFGVLLHDIGKPSTFRVAERIRFDGHVEAGLEIGRQILNRLRFSHDDTGQVLALIANHMRFMDVRKMRESTLKRFLRLPRFEEHHALHRLDCGSSHGLLDNWEFVNERRQTLGEEEIAPARLLSGNDLIALGYAPGPAFTRILRAVEDAQLEGAVHTKEEAIALVKEMVPEQTTGQSL